MLDADKSQIIDIHWEYKYCTCTAVAKCDVLALYSDVLFKVCLESKRKLSFERN